MPTLATVFAALLAACSVVGLPGQAWAAERTWSGFYLGVNIGSASSDVSKTLRTPVDGINPNFITVDADTINAAGSRSWSSGELSIGGQVGYNIQFGSVVLGTELDLGRLGFKGHSETTTPEPVGSGGMGDMTVATSAKASKLMTLRARLGLVAGSGLFYVTGGLAYSKVSFSQSTTFAAVPTNDDASDTDHKFGWTIGTGAELPLNRDWTIKAEYLYADLGSVGKTTTPVSPYGVGEVPFAHRMNVTTQIARVGLNFRY